MEAGLTSGPITRLVRRPYENIIRHLQSLFLAFRFPFSVSVSFFPLFQI